MALGLRRLRRVASQLRSDVQSQPCHLDPETCSELLEISTVNPIVPQESEGLTHILVQIAASSESLHLMQAALTLCYM